MNTPLLAIQGFLKKKHGYHNGTISMYAWFSSCTFSVVTILLQPSLFKDFDKIGRVGLVTMQEGQS